MLRALEPPSKYSGATKGISEAAYPTLTALDEHHARASKTAGSAIPNSANRTANAPDGKQATNPSSAASPADPRSKLFRLNRSPVRSALPL